MEKTEFKAQIAEEAIKPSDLELRALQFKAGPVEAMFYGVYGKGTKGDDIWLATFYDRDEAEAWVIASKTYGRAVLGASVPTQQEEIDAARVPSGDQTPQAN